MVTSNRLRRPGCVVGRYEDKRVKKVWIEKLERAKPIERAI